MTLANITNYTKDPSRVIDDVLTDLERSRDIEIVDSSNAFILLMEMATILAADSINNIELSLQTRFANLALNMKELYPHLNSTDIKQLLAQPTRTQLTVNILLPSFKANAVWLADENCHIAVIPKRTEINVDDLVFSLDRAVEVRLYHNHVVKVRYLEDNLHTSIHADLALINNPVVLNDANQEPWMRFSLDIRQIDYYTYSYAVPPTYGVREVISYTDQLSSIEVLYLDNDQQKPMDISFSDKVYNSSTPTAIVEINSQQQTVTIVIPPIYILDGAVAGSILVVIGTTKGDIDRVMDNYNITDYTVAPQQSSSLIALTAQEQAFLNVDYFVYISKPLDGGRQALSFKEIQQRITTRAFGPPEQPITKSQLAANLNDLGYRIVKYEGGVSGRTYVVTDDIPSVPDLPFSSSLGIGMMSITTSMSDLSKLPGTIVFKDSITILPTQLYSYNGTAIDPVFDSPLTIAASTSKSERVALINSRKYLFSPLYYSVTIHQQDKLKVTPWSLNRPKVDYIDRKDSNSILPDIFDRKSATLLTTDTGFQLVIQLTRLQDTAMLNPTDSFALLRYQANDANVYYLNAVVSEDSVYMYYSFDIPSSFYLTDTQISLTFTNDILVDAKLPVSIIYGLNTKPATYLNTDIDDLLSPALINKAALLHEVFHLTLGTPLPGLWTDARVLNRTPIYEVYEEDVYYTKEEVIISRDETSSQLPFTIDDDCTINYKPAHTQEVNVLDSDGNPILLHKAGDIKVDEYGRLIDTASSNLRFTWSHLVMDDALLYIDSPAIVDLLRLIQQDIVYKCTDQLDKLKSRLLERTDIYYSPIRTIGQQSLYSNDTIVDVVDLNISPIVTLTVPNDVYGDSQSRELLKTQTVELLNNYFDSPDLSYDQLIRYMLDSYGEVVLSVSIEGLPNVLDSRLVSYDNNTSHLTVGTRVTINNQGYMELKDDILINFISR